MSDSGAGSGDDTFDDGGDPFKGMPPLIGDLARMMRQQGAMGPDLARQVAVSVATEGRSEPNIDPTDRMALEQLARVAELQVAGTTGLPTAVAGRSVTVVPVTRFQWVIRALDDFRPYFDALSGSLQQPGGAGDASAGAAGIEAGDAFGWMAPLLKLMAPMMQGMMTGSMVGHLAQRCFGQYDLPIPRPRSDELYLALGNLDDFGNEWSLPPDDLRLWVCLHEMTHHAVLGLPHVHSALDRMLRDYLAGFESDPGTLEDRLAGFDFDPGRAGELGSEGMGGLGGLEAMFGDPEVLLGAIQSPAQRQLLPRLAALVAPLVGYVDHVMDTIGGTLIGSYGMVTEALRRRRVEAAASDRFVEKLFGLELSQATYDRGSAFVGGVVERAGADGLARLWESDRTLPTPAEVDAPGLWLARIDLPGDD